MAIIYKSTAPTYVDNRPASYKKIASRSASKRLAAAKQKAEEQSQTKIAISNDNIVRSDTSSQVAISGNPSNNLVRTNVTTTPEPIIANPLPQVSPNNAYTVALQGRPVSVSPGVASKLAQQSIRQDQTYTVYAPTRQRSSYLPISNAPSSKATGELRAAKEPTDFSAKLRQKSNEASFKADKGNNPLYYNFVSAGASAASTFTLPFVNPVRFVKESYLGVKELATNPVGVGFAVGESIKNTPGSFAGELAGGYMLGKLPTFVKGVYIKAGSTYVAPESVFDVGVLKGETKFPETTSIKNSMLEFNKPSSAGDIVVLHSSPGKIKGQVSGAGPRAVSGVEDPGIYVAPKGRGSPAFTGLTTGEVSSYSLSVNPLKGLFDVPSVTEFKVKGVVQYPRSVITTPGFGVVSKYQEEVLANKGVAVITKRSELGQGNIPVDYSISGKNKYGTTEVEAVIPKGSRFEYTPTSTVGKLKGFDEYTLVGGKPVAIRKTRVLGEGEVGLLTEDSQIVKTNTIVRGGRSYSELSSVSINPSRALNYGSLYKTRSSIKSSSTSPGYSSVGSYSSSGSKISSSSPKVSSFVSSNGSSSQVVESFTSTRSSLSTTKSSDKTSSFSGVSSKSSSSIGNVFGSSSGSGVSSSYGGSSFKNKNTNDKPFSKKGKEDEGLFSVLVRRRGEFKTVAQARGLKKAVDVGVSKIRGGLGATFIIKKGATTIKVDSPSKEFYSKSSGEVIQKRGFRLSSRGEVVEIGFENRRSGNRRGLF